MSTYIGLHIDKTASVLYIETMSGNERILIQCKTVSIMISKQPYILSFCIFHNVFCVCFGFRVVKTEHFVEEG